MSVTGGAEYPESGQDGMSIVDMTPKPQHAKPRDHLWVLAIIAGFAMYDVWEAWTQIGDKSGFAHGTGWTLTIIAEAYWGYSLFALFRAPGKRSRRFAGWSAGAVFAMSAASQVASHLAADKVPPAAVVGFVSVLPVTVLALIAFLVHLRQKDREDSAEAVRQDAKDAEIAALQAELGSERASLAPLREALAEAQQMTEEANAARETAERKLDAQKANGRRTKPANGTRRSKANGAANGAAKPPAKAVTGTEVPDDFDARAEALELYLANPDISGKELGETVGLTARWGQLRKAEFAKAVAGTGASDERS